MLKILLLSPYHGGSHRAWAEGYQAQSEHQIELLTMPARFWKWRMHGAAITLARRFLEQEMNPDLIVATDMLDLSTFLALTRQTSAEIPAILYMHENQLTYPLPADGRTGPMRRQKGERDRHYAFINLASMLSADHIVFNSHFHRETFLGQLPMFLGHFPEYNERNSIETLRERSNVLPVGIDLRRFGSLPTVAQARKPPLILWNQRWEYDKQPQRFFAALYAMLDEGLSFRVALCGQRFGRQPAVFSEAQTRLGDRIIHAGYADPEHYIALLKDAAVTLSTAVHEFFGISIVEAIYAQTYPILPKALSYPEIIPPSFHELCLYENSEQMLNALRWTLNNPDSAHQRAANLAPSMAAYDWAVLAPKYDHFLESKAQR